ncbi:hypothetical protein HKX48_008322 [Thoreauomyces humboldtii]|nr:hypothetical protein HKX48_008322 [Thoreauomyces humboldtii]
MGLRTDKHTANTVYPITNPSSNANVNGKTYPYRPPSPTSKPASHPTRHATYGTITASTDDKNFSSRSHPPLASTGRPYSAESLPSLATSSYGDLPYQHLRLETIREARRSRRCRTVSILIA